MFCFFLLIALPIVIKPFRLVSWVYLFPVIITANTKHIVRISKWPHSIAVFTTFMELFLVLLTSHVQVTSFSNSAVNGAICMLIAADFRPSSPVISLKSKITLRDSQFLTLVHWTLKTSAQSADCCIIIDGYRLDCTSSVLCGYSSQNIQHLQRFQN
jgi:hypothetical protein